MADTGTASAPMTAEEERTKQVAIRLLRNINGLSLPSKVGTVAAVIRAAEQEARAALMEEFRQAEKQALAAAKADAAQRGVEREREAIAQEGDRRLSKASAGYTKLVLRGFIAAIRDRAKQTETA